MEATFSFSFSLPLILLLYSLTLSSSTPISSLTTDQEALIAFKNALDSNPNNSKLINWSTNTSTCYWTGVTCGAKHQRVTALKLSGFGLRGTLAPHLGNLTFLRTLDISSNYFSGVLPSELSKLRRLMYINVGKNEFEGEIPSWFEALPRIQYIALNENAFSGDMPPSLFSISSLVEIYLTFNQLSGELPNDTCRNTPDLRGIYLAKNKLSGQIPASIYCCRKLVELRLGDNQFRGSIPSEIGNLTMLRSLSLYSNFLQGGIPTFNNLPKLEELDLDINNLTGSIPKEIGYLTSLQTLLLSYNLFTGNIPEQVGNLTSLVELNLAGNRLTGNIPKQVGNLTSLVELNLSGNRLTGGIPAFNNLTKLEILNLDLNNLTGNIPKQVGNLTSLVELNLARNRLTGELPEELGNLASLENLWLGFNDFLNGSIPSSIFNLSALKILSLPQNQISGVLPSNMGLSLPNLEELYLFWNKFTGEIPRSINNATELTMLELNNNSFIGSIPDFGNLRNLQSLRLWMNNLTSPTQELGFLSSLTNSPNLKYLEISYNPHLNGTLPSTVGNLSSSSLISFLAANCSIRGTIPSEFGNLTSLLTLDLSGNRLTGVIPTTLGKLKQLGKLYLYDNELQGSIPPHLCQMSDLLELYLSNNSLTGPIPECLGEVKSLREVSFALNNLNSTLPPTLFNLVDLISLDLSSNSLTGQIPDEVQRFKAMNWLSLSSNKFEGSIPRKIGKCESLQALILSNNSFDGSIPESLGDVRVLGELDLSYNNLSGTIPESLTKLSLSLFNVSYNNLEGEIPDEGYFKNLSALSFLHNSALCGAARFRVSATCGGKSRPKSAAQVLIYVIPPFVAVLILAAGLFFLIRRCTPKKAPAKADNAIVGAGWKVISEIELKQRTNSFSDTNLHGRGSFGSVFKATLSDGMEVAVKVFNLQAEGAVESFETESRILSTIRHRNLVKILGCCSSPDFKALILAYMPNGSLEEWLHSDKYFLDLMQRLDISLDVALALEYLHHDHTFPVVHRDIKPSNVLLDEDMTAHVGDFGISKLFDDGEAAVHTLTMATVGYVAPEFGREGKVSTSGDVYSYGILLLEIFTSKRPRDEMFGGEMSIKEWAEKALQDNAIDEIVAPSLLSREDPDFSAKLECVKSVFHLAMKCLASSPEERVKMLEVVAALKKIKAKVPVKEVKANSQVMDQTIV